MRIPSLKNISIVSFSLFLLSGIFESLPFFQMVPIKALSLITPTIYILLFFIKTFRIPKSLFWTLPLLITLIPSYINSEITLYSKEKTVTFLTVFLISTIYASFLLRTKEDLKVFLQSLGTVGMIICIIGLSNFGSLKNQTRLTVNDSNPIWLSRAVSFSFVWYIILYIHKKINLFWMLFLNSLILLVMIGTGSKGPLLAVFISLVIIYAPYISRLFLRLKNYFILIGLSLFSYGFYLVLIKILPYETLYRLTTIFSDDASASELSRKDLYKTALDLIPENPFGIGLGHFNEFSYFYYPHNLVLESFAEGGWIFGTHMVILLLTSLFIFNKLSKTKDYIYQGLYALFLIALINSMFSGDLTSPKELYMSISLSLTFYIIELTNKTKPQQESKKIGLLS
jgi:hypothetical protein